MNDELRDDLAYGQPKQNHRIATLGWKIAGWARSAETRFLSLLRYTALGIAAFALIASAILLVLGLARQIGRTKVEPEKVSIAVTDVVPLASKDEKEPTSAPSKPSLPKAIRDKTASIYRNNFASYERADNKISEEQAVDLVWPEERIAVFEDLANLGLQGSDGKELIGKEAVMGSALDTISKATMTEDYVNQLVGYQKAKKVNVCTNVTRSRERIVEGWDRYSTSCYAWWESPVGCSTTRVISEPYSERVCEMKYPAELKAPAALLAASIQRYADSANSGIEAARIDAEAETAENFNRKLKGQSNIGDSGKLFLGFLSVMFLYLFVAMERHNRNLQALATRFDSEAS